MRTKIFTLIVGVLAMAFIGCTRAAKDDAKLNLRIASSVDGQGSLAAGTQVLAHVSINVSGSGIANTIVYTWDNCQDCSVQTAIPENFQLSVPSGSGRLIQILAVYKDSTTNQMTFYYGDVSKDLSGSETTAEINVAKVGSGNITSGRVAGRYFTTATSGPTGLIDIKYNPGSGKLPLIVDNAVIVNGWFSMFMLSGANLEYSVRGSEEKLWGQEMSFESAAMDPAENSGFYFDQRVRALLPVHIEKREENNTTTYKIQDAETYVWGYWGPGATGKKVCTSGLDSSPVPQRLRQYKTGDLSASDPLSVSHYINWNLAVPTKAQLTDTVNPYTYVVFQGGVSMSSGCGSFTDTFANQFTNFQKITLNQIDGKGGDSVAGFTGIFRNNSNNNFATVSSADPKVITADLLPGVEEVFSGLRLFKRVNSEDYRLEIPKCDQLAGLGFIPASSADTPVTAAGSVSLTSNITAAEGTGGVTAVICPVKAGVVAPVGVFMSKWNFNMGGGSVGSNSPATKLALVAPQKTAGSGTIVNNLCTPVTIEARTASDTIGYLPNMVNINLASVDGNTAFYGYNSCSGPITSIQTASSYTTVYVKRSVSGSTSVNLSASAGGLATATSTINFVDAPGTITPKIVVNMPSTIAAYECYPVTFESWNSNLYMVSLYDTYATSFTLNLASGTGIGYYYGPDCNSGNFTSANLGTSPQSSPLYFKYTGSATTLNLQPTSISPSSPILTSDFVGGNNVTVVQPGTSTALDLVMPTSFQEGQCQTVMVRSTDANGRTSPAASAMTVNLSSISISGTYYQYGGCTSPITSVNFAAGATSQFVYFKATIVGSGTAIANSSSPVMSVSRNITITPATFSQIAIMLPGQYFVPGAAPGNSAQGTPTPVPQGVMSYMDIYLVKYDGQIDTTATGYFLTGGSASNASIPTPAGIYFTNGVATGIGFTPYNPYIDVGVSVQAGMIYGNSTSTPVFVPATMFNIYMSNSAVLAPGGCQIFAVIPESSDGASSVLTPTNYTIAADNGASIYTDANCTNPASGTYTFNPNNRIAAYYFKQPSSNTSSAITVTPTNGIISTPLNVATNATSTGASYAYLFTGRMNVSMKAAVCQPYLVSVADVTGRSVVIGSDQAVTLQVNSGGGTVGTFDNQSCDWPYDGAPTSIPAATNYVSVFLTAMISGSTHLLNASGSPLQSTTSTGIVPNP